jgi:hypothetical protein
MKYRKKVLGLLLFFLLFSACKQNNIQIDYINVSKKNIGNSNYHIIYSSAKDSIENWVENDLGLYGYFKKYNRGYKLDPLLCFNTKKDKMIGALLINHKVFENAKLDDIWYFYGIKINNQWFFFNGADITLLREYYQKDIHTPLSFEKLHEIAMKEVFSGYLKKKDKSYWTNLFGKTEWEINDDFFSDLTSVAWCTDCKTKEQWNAAYLKIIREHWQSRDTMQNK